MIRINDPETGWRDAQNVGEYPRTIPLTDIRAHNANAGHYFFFTATMKAWKSRVLGQYAKIQPSTGLYLFITSEARYGGARGYSVRAYNPGTGSIQTADGFSLCSTPQAAKNWLAAHLV